MVLIPPSSRGTHALETIRRLTSEWWHWLRRRWIDRWQLWLLFGLLLRPGRVVSRRRQKGFCVGHGVENHSVNTLFILDQFKRNRSCICRDKRTLVCVADNVHLWFIAVRGR